MARKDPSNRAGNGEMGALKEKMASSRSKRLLQQIDYNQQKSKSDAAKNKFAATSGIPPQTVTRYMPDSFTLHNYLLMVSMLDDIGVR